MQEAATEAMQKDPPGNANGVGMWIGGEDVQIAKEYFSWFRSTNP
jgi:hypothetical protein